LTRSGGKRKRKRQDEKRSDGSKCDYSSAHLIHLQSE
jgi:hypothetical protein